MREISIVNRELSPHEIEQLDAGFDALYAEEGVELERTERMCIAALLENKIIGCAVGLAHKNGANYSGWFSITDVFVVKEHRSKGLGKTLLNALEECAMTKGIDHFWLWTSGSKAIKFYRNNGYKKFIEMENWYSNGSSRVGMKKRLVRD